MGILGTGLAEVTLHGGDMLHESLVSEWWHWASGLGQGCMASLSPRG